MDRICRTGLLKSIPLLAALISASAAALPVTTWQYTLQTKFSGSNAFSAGGGSQTQTAGEVSWGTPGGNVYVNTGDANTNRSGITIAQTANGNPPDVSPISGMVNTNDLANPGTGHWITHHNNPISSAYATLLTTHVDSMLTLMPFVPLGPAFPPATIDFTVNFLETPNAAPCLVSTSPVACNDVFAMAGDNFNQDFLFGGDHYFISIYPTAGPGVAGGSLPLLGSSICTAAGAPANCVGFTTVEGQDNSFQFGFVITSQPINVVPDPGTVWLLGSMLLGLAAMRRRCMG